MVKITELRLDSEWVELHLIPHVCFLPKKNSQEMDVTQCHFLAMLTFDEFPDPLHFAAEGNLRCTIFQTTHQYGIERPAFSIFLVFCLISSPYILHVPSAMFKVQMRNRS